MIKEKIESIPGGRQFVIAEKFMGIIIGSLSTMLILFIVAGAVLGSYYTIGTMEFVILAGTIGLYLVVLAIFCTIAYYDNLKKAYKTYLDKVGESHE